MSRHPFDVAAIQCHGGHTTLIGRRRIDMLPTTPGSESMSTMRSSSERPLDTATLASQIGRPSASVSAANLPLSNPPDHRADGSSALPLPRKVSTGSAAIINPMPRAVAASRPIDLPSMVARTTIPVGDTRRGQYFAGHSPAMPACHRRHRTPPLGPSRCPPAPDHRRHPTPPDRLQIDLVFQSVLPVPASKAQTPPPSASEQLAVTQRRRQAHWIVRCALAPTFASQTRVTLITVLMSSSLAGGVALSSPAR